MDIIDSKDPKSLNEHTISSVFTFQGKARTLELLSKCISSALFCEQVIINHQAWLDNKNTSINKILDRFDGQKLAIRSSAKLEDTATHSNAGVHSSLINVEPKLATIRSAINEVFSSYGTPSEYDDVLIQPMVQNVAASGVLFTRDLDTGSPYYVINYDDFSGRTDTVTSGGESKTILVHRSRRVIVKSRRFNHLLDAVADIEAATNSDALDIEFCINKDEKIFILQVRPLTVERNWQNVSEQTFDRLLDTTRGAVTAGMAPHDNVAGQTSIFGEMPDWNPAEIIGSSPRPLASSLYRNLITDKVWADARAAMGYQRVDHPLMVSFAGRPYIDVRLSLNSFLPAGVATDTAEQLINSQITHLNEHPGAHDKIEFEIALTCHDFDPASMSDQLQRYGLNLDDVEDFICKLHVLTTNALNWHEHGLRDAVALSRNLLSHDLHASETNPLEKIQLMLVSCQELGTLPFSQLARHGFISASLLRSLVKRSLIDEALLDTFMRGVHTVASDFIRDVECVHNDTLDTTVFLKRYGHLRPGTYDILSWRYDERPNLFLDHVPPKIERQETTSEMDPVFDQALNSMLSENNFSISAVELKRYMVTSIEGREESKFAFTKCISDILVVLKRWGEDHNFSADQLSFLTIDDILNTLDIGALREVSTRNAESYALNRLVRLPHLITCPEDIDVVRLPLGRPTFVTMKRVSAPPVYLQSHDAPDLDGKIVLIESADPGFDWIFSRDILGLVTKYGGSNSHMAIRCAEFGLPAAIGCGERLFETLTSSRVVQLDCASHRVSGH